MISSIVGHILSHFFFNQKMILEWLVVFDHNSQSSQHKMVCLGFHNAPASNDNSGSVLEIDSVS